MSTTPEWHDDPTAPGTGRRRYWDGAQWSDWVIDPGSQEPRSFPVAEAQAQVASQAHPQENPTEVLPTAGAESIPPATAADYVAAESTVAMPADGTFAAGEPAKRSKVPLIVGIVVAVVLVLVVGGIAAASFVFNRVSDAVSDAVASASSQMSDLSDGLVTSGPDEAGYVSYVHAYLDGTDYESQLDGVSDADLVDMGYGICEATDPMSAQEFASYYEDAWNVDGGELNATAVEGAQWYLCDNDRLTEYWASDSSTSDPTASADGLDYADMPSDDDPEAMYLWMLGIWDAGLDDSTALDAGYWVCAQYDAGAADSVDSMTGLLDATKERYGVDDMAAAGVMYTAIELCPEWTDAVTSVEG
ncbi:hypothetical protein RN607_14385 [Demequina capsici]|uniref:DUF2510 domain-containing protein n=1 Tax=Demequina capsici TaxID=3075620 RepID=A0AA96FCN0_9MICO|nr:hypothetical protein [Demequina sp. PMTSA13]WNM27368.1 hypothetical protein RN607_14385 [Demequina sp. PMTSA13]